MLENIQLPLAYPLPPAVAEANQGSDPPHCLLFIYEHLSKVNCGHHSHISKIIFCYGNFISIYCLCPAQYQSFHHTHTHILYGSYTERSNQHGRREHQKISRKEFPMVGNAFGLLNLTAETLLGPPENSATKQSKHHLRSNIDSQVQLCNQLKMLQLVNK